MSSQKPKQGFKLVPTLFGKYKEIPKNWEQKKLQEITKDPKKSFSMGPFGSNIKTENYVSEGVPVLRGINLNNDVIEEENFVFLTETKADKLLNSNTFRNDVLLTSQGTVGDVGIIPENSKFQRYVLSQNLMKITPEPNIVTPYYIFYFLQTRLLQNELFKYVYGLGVPAIAQPLTTFRNLHIVFPQKISEQEKIISILSNFDNLIYSYRETIRHVENLKTGLMQKLFHPKENKKLRKIKLGKIVKFSSGEFLPEKNQKLGDIPVYGGNGINGWHNKSMVNEPTIVFGRVGAHCGSVHITNSPSWITDNAIFVKELSEEVLVDYLFRFLKRLNINLLAEVSAQPKISQGILKQILIRYPIDKKIQQKTIFILNNMDSRIRILDSKKSNIQNLKNTLLQNLLTGQICVKV